jgi:hypothetical protein
MNESPYLWPPRPVPSLKVKGRHERALVNRIFCVGRLCKGELKSQESKCGADFLTHDDEANRSSARAALRASRRQPPVRRSPPGAVTNDSMPADVAAVFAGFPSAFGRGF